ncbi:hypothetical protein MLD38_015665 [Melastoma candidum]|nr:hypothetical protein MLD38_015665 [Melastoma candidum]
MSKPDFIKFRICCMFAGCVLQMVVLRPCLQMYLNEAVLSWYQRLHASRAPDLDFSRAKVFLHNHYICLTVLQFFAPPALALLFLGLSQIDDHSFGKVDSLCTRSTSCSVAIKQVSGLLAWWVNINWVVFTTATLAFYRCGLLYVS